MITAAILLTLLSHRIPTSALYLVQDLVCMFHMYAFIIIISPVKKKFKVCIYLYANCVVWPTLLDVVLYDIVIILFA